MPVRIVSPFCDLPLHLEIAIFQSLSCQAMNFPNIAHCHRLYGPPERKRKHTHTHRPPADPAHVVNGTDLEDDRPVRCGKTSLRTTKGWLEYDVSLCVTMCHYVTECFNGFRYDLPNSWYSWYHV